MTDPSNTPPRSMSTAAYDAELIRFLESNRDTVATQYVEFVRHSTDAHYRSDDTAVIRQRIEVFLDKLIASIAKADMSIIVDYVNSVAHDRIAAGYDVKAVIDIYDWFSQVIMELIRSKLGQHPGLSYFERRVNFAASNGKIALTYVYLSEQAKKRRPPSQ